MVSKCEWLFLGLVVIILTESHFAKASTAVEAGSDYTIYCSDNGRNISGYYFRMIHPTEKVFNSTETESAKFTLQKLDKDTRLALTIHNIEEQQYKLQCFSDKKIFLYSDIINAGTSPKKPLHYKCRIYERLYANCTFIIPKNTITTDYQFCKLRDYCDKIIEENKQSLGFNETCNCYTDVYSYAFFIDSPTSDLKVKLKAFNELDTWEESYIFDKTKNALLNATLLDIESIHSNGVNIIWNYFPPNESKILHEIVVSWGSMPLIKYNIDDKILFNGVKRTCFIDLPHPYVYYSIRLRRRLADAYDDEDMWTESNDLNVRTLPARPKKSPKTSINSFQIKDSKAILFWKALEAYERNGPNFNYSIQIDGGAKYFTEGTSFKMDVQKNKIYRCSIRAVNEEGESHQSSLIVVNTFKNPKLSNILSSSFLHNDTYFYNLSWSEAPDASKLLNYTVFWCKKKISQNECERNFDFEDVSRSQHSFQMPNEDGLMLGVIANYKDFSSGMQWAECHGNLFEDLYPPTLRINRAWNDSFNVSWSHRVCESIIEKYELSYREVGDNSIEPKVLAFGQSQNHAIIQNLKPCTIYELSLTMFSKIKTANVLVKASTAASAPNPPLDLHLHKSKTSSNSAFISWRTPPPTYCDVTGYLIELKSFNLENKLEYGEKCLKSRELKVEEHQMNLTLENLCSFANYQVLVKSSHNNVTSLPSNIIKFTTLIGKPMQPAKPEYADMVLSWPKYSRPFAPISYYKVDLVKKSKNDPPKVLSYTLVKELSCHISHQNCSEYSDSLYLQITAISIPTESDQLDSNFKTNKQLLVDSLLDKELCSESQDFDVLPSEYIASEASQAVEMTRCEYLYNKYTLFGFSFLTVIIVGGFGIYVVIRAKKCWKKMQNIHVEIPEGLKPFDNANSDMLISQKKSTGIISNMNNKPISTASSPCQKNSSSESETLDTISSHSSDQMYEHVEEQNSLEDLHNLTPLQFGLTNDFGSYPQIPEDPEPEPEIEILVKPQPPVQTFSSYVAADDLVNSKMPKSLPFPRETSCKMNDFHKEIRANLVDLKYEESKQPIRETFNNNPNQNGPNGYVTPHTLFSMAMQK